MTSSLFAHILRSSLPMLASAFAIGCAGSAGPAQHPVYSPSTVEGPTAKCERLCGVVVVAENVEAFCAALTKKARTTLGGAVECKPQGALGLPTRAESAVRDAMLVDLIVTAPEEARYSVLAVRTARGWELAREVGIVRGAAVNKSESVQVIGARPVDDSDLAPFAVEVRVRINAQGEKLERVFVCGKKDAAVTCSRAVEISG